MKETVLVQGVAVPYGRPSVRVPTNCNGIVQFAPGAFRESIEAGQVELWIDHERDKVITRQGIGRFALFDEPEQSVLMFSALIQDPKWVPVVARMTNFGVSIGWRSEEVDLGTTVPTIQKARLREVSLLQNQLPAFGGTFFRVTV